MERKLTCRLIDQFREHLFAEEKSLITIEKYIRDITKFSEYVVGRELSKQRVIEYKKELVSQGYAAASINSMLAAVNSFFTFCGWNDLKIKLIKIQRNMYCSTGKELSRQEYYRLLDAAKRKGDKRTYLILQTICGTGIRISELKYISVEAANEGKATVTCKGKTRVIFFVRALQKQLTQYCRDMGIEHGPIFITRTGKPINRITVWREMKSLCITANVNAEKVYPHNLRHLFARIFYSLDKDIVKLADILGHSNMNTTRIYTISSGLEHRRFMESMHLVI